jgi:glycosyltransferase involved in cell wall biosynthesis
MALTVSVVIPTYNRAALVARAVASALMNIERGDEILVVDDGSSDNTRQALSPFGNSIRLLEGRHAGAGAARNFGIRQARGDIIAFLDSDDEWQPNKLRLQRALLKARPDVLFCFSDFGLKEAETRQHRYLTQWHHDTRGWDEILGPATRFSALAALPAGVNDFAVHIGNIALSELRADYISTITLAVRRIESNGALRFAEDVSTYEDWECFARLAAAGNAAYMDFETAWNCGHSGPRLTDADAYAAASARIKIMERTWGQDPAFLAQHAAAYAERRSQFYRLRARWLLCRGRTSEARADLRRAGSGPMADRVLARLPGTLVRHLLDLRRVVGRRGRGD